MEDKLILLKREKPISYEIHRGEIKQLKNLILTTNDLDFAEKLVSGYNNLNIISENKLNCKCPICSNEMVGINLTHYKCKKCNEYFTN